jgi:tetratricopeptide (TPR) repeat protein
LDKKRRATEPPPIQIGKLWVELALTKHEQSQYTSAEAAYTHALALFEHDPAAARDYATTLSNLGALYYDTGRPDAAERMDLRSLDVAQRLGDTLRVGHAEGQLSQLYLQEHRLKKPAEYSLKASEDLSQTPDVVNRALALVIHTYATCEKHCEEGLRSAQQAMEIVLGERTPNLIAIGQAYIARGFADQQTGATLKAGDDMRDGVRLLKQDLQPSDARLINALKLYREYLAANHRNAEAAEITAHVEAADQP